MPVTHTNVLVIALNPNPSHASLVAGRDPDLALLRFRARSVDLAAFVVSRLDEDVLPAVFVVSRDPAPFDAIVSRTTDSDTDPYIHRMGWVR